jgi:hypothetical protein
MVAARGKQKSRKNMLEQLAEAVLVELDVRSRDVIRRRFGLDSGESQTLEYIGKDYGITRERVRQIEHHAKKIVGKKLAELAPAAEILDQIFRMYGGSLTEERAVHLAREHVHAEFIPTVINFYLEILPPYSYVTNDPHFLPHWRHPEAFPKTATEVVRAGKTLLQKNQRPRQEAEFINEIRQHLGASEQHAPEHHVCSWLLCSKYLHKNPFGEWGLVGWAEITPRGVGDKAYAVLRRHGRPEHFRKIADLINAAQFDRKTANAQTVHNELIKDERFVLVGRGMYGLAEWGYMPGTVADVLEAILSKHPEGLDREELIEKVLKERMVKKNTILLSLQDQSRFVKKDNNRYTLKG